MVLNVRPDRSRRDSGNLRSGRGFSAFDLSEPMAGALCRCLDIHIARDDERSIRRPIECAEERADIVQRGPVEVLHVADRGMSVGMALRKRPLEYSLDGEAVRPVLIGLPAFVLHHIPLVVQFRLRD